jgi:hypothetical protein
MHQEPSRPERERPRAAVIDMRSRRRSQDIVETISFVFGGVHYGTVAVSRPYTKGKPIVLYVVPRNNSGDETFEGPVDILMTDDACLAERYREAR